MEILSLIGIFAGLAVMIYLTYKGHSIIWVAPLSALIVVLFSLGAGLPDGSNVLTTYTVDYMKGAGEYFISWFPVFLLGAIYGKVMDVTGAARALAELIIRFAGSRFAVLAVILPCMILTYGGVSLFVVVFIMYPMGYAIYKSADIPRTFLPAAIAFGAFGITMTSIPGTPQIQNLIPMPYFGTTAAAAPALGIVAALLVGIPGYLYLDSRVRKAKKEGRHFSEDIEFTEGASCMVKNSPLLWLSCLIPLVVVFVTLNVLKWNIIVSLLVGIAVCLAMNFRQFKKIPEALTEGAKGSVTAIMNTACAVGFGSVLRIVPGFMILTGILIGSISSKTGLFISESISAAVLSGATGSASGGLSIALEAFAGDYLQAASQLNVDPELLHRFASIAAGSLDKLPHNGAVITLLAVTHCAHKESYKDIFVVAVLIPVAALIVLILLWGLLFS